jgi:hypothetical protein
MGLMYINPITKKVIESEKTNDKKTITRNALWTDKCRYWLSKSGRMLMTYFDIDADGYRTASDTWSIKL